MLLYSQLTDAGFSFRSDGERLIVSPASRLTDDQRAAIRENKEALLLETRLSAPLEPTELDNLIWDNIEAGRLVGWKEYKALWDGLSMK